jgi:hypothetical protein
MKIEGLPISAERKRQKQCVMRDFARRCERHNHRFRRSHGGFFIRCRKVGDRGADKALIIHEQKSLITKVQALDRTKGAMFWKQNFGDGGAVSNLTGVGPVSELLDHLARLCLKL